MGKNNSSNHLKTSEGYKSLPHSIIDSLPYYDNIRASWIANISHCDPNSPSKRNHYIDKGITMSSEWSGAVGFLRYYIWHIDNGYIPRKTKLKRIDNDKGFSPQNCIIEKNPEKKPTKQKVVNILSRKPSDIININDWDGFMRVISLITKDKTSESIIESTTTMIQLISQITSVNKEERKQ